jgi:Trypsin-like peptidase domain
VTLSERTTELLRELLREITVAVLADGKVIGSAFYVADDLLLTCEHVVHGHDELVVAAVDGRQRPVLVEGTPDQAEDLALLRLTATGDQALQPAAALDDRLHEGDHMVAGFPRDDLADAGLEIYPVAAHSRDPLDAGRQVLQIRAGQMITFGMSGGPVVSARTGAVVGVVRSSRDALSAMGGGAIPIGTAARVFAEIDGLLRRPQPAVRRWRDALGRDGWQLLGKQWDMQVLLDLRISGERKCWIVRSGGTGAARSITAGDLGEDVAEALFRWAAQRRRIHGREEVELLGRLLAKGLVPPDAADLLRRADGADRIHVRLHVETGNDLADIPWELAAVPGHHPAKYFATDDAFLFSRVEDDPEQRPPRWAPLTGAVEVLAVLAQPGGWRFAPVYGRNNDRPYPWPDLDVMARTLHTAVEGDPFKLTLKVNPQPGDVTDLLNEGSYAVLHFVGVGKLGRDGTPLVALVDDDGEFPSWTEVTGLLAEAAANGIRLVILEFLLPPEGLEFDPITPSTLGTLVTGATAAVVLTQQPVHPKQFQAFNREFYKALRGGAAVETATQLARRRLALDNPVEDEAGYGWFTVITGPQAGAALITRTDGPPGGSQGRQQIAAPDGSAQPGPAVVVDVLPG